MVCGEIGGLETALTAANELDMVTFVVAHSLDPSVNSRNRSIAADLAVTCEGHRDILGRGPDTAARAPSRVRHLFAAYDLGKNQLYGHIKKTKNRSKFLEFCRYLRSLHPVDVHIAIICDN